MKNNNSVVEMKVSKTTQPKSGGGSLAKYFRSGTKIVHLLAIGAESINQAMKCVAVANQYLEEDGLEGDLLVKPTFQELVVSGEDKSKITYLLIEVQYYE